MRATAEVEHSRRAQGAGARGARWPAWLGVLLATVRLVVLSAVGLAGAILALLPVALQGGPSGRRVARLPTPAAAPPAAGDAPGAFVGRRAGEAGRR